MMSNRGQKGVILFFAHCNNYHTIKWAKHFATAGYCVHIASLEACRSSDLIGQQNITVHWLRNSGERMGGTVQKLKYLRTVHDAKKLIDDINPDIVHAHYASSYGLICALSCHRPFYLSVWGSDVYEFPRKSPLHRAVLTFALSKCSWLLSTSEAMAIETLKYINKPISITPFGVDMEQFNPNLRNRCSDGKLIIGTVKALERKYGIDILLHATAKLRERRSDVDVNLRIAGKGTLEEELKALAKQLGLDDVTSWLGFIPQSDVAQEWANFDIGVVPSESESFGVSAVECQACGTPLIISDIPGLMEACNGGKTALVFPRRDVAALEAALEKLIDDRGLRTEMSANARAYVEGDYEVNDCFRRVEAIYETNMGGV